MRAENPALRGQETCAFMRLMMGLAYAYNMAGLASCAVMFEMQHLGSHDKTQACHLRFVTLSRLC